MSPGETPADCGRDARAPKGAGRDERELLASDKAGNTATGSVVVTVSPPIDETGDLGPVIPDRESEGDAAPGPRPRRVNAGVATPSPSGSRAPPGPLCGRESPPPTAGETPALRKA